MAVEAAGAEWGSGSPPWEQGLGLLLLLMD